MSALKVFSKYSKLHKLLSRVPKINQRTVNPDPVFRNRIYRLKALIILRLFVYSNKYQKFPKNIRKRRQKTSGWLSKTDSS